MPDTPDCVALGSATLALVILSFLLLAFDTKYNSWSKGVREFILSRIGVTVVRVRVFSPAADSPGKLLHKLYSHGTNGS